MTARMALLFRIVRRVAVLVVLGWALWWLLLDPKSPLPPEWHPATPLDVTADQTWLTGMKLRRAVSSDEACFAALATGAVFERLTPLDAGPQCGIAPRLLLQSVDGVPLSPVETTCMTALRVAMWQRHTLRPAAARLGTQITRLRHQGSYNCRSIRGDPTRMSTHATARAIDIRGVRLADGRAFELISGWDDTGEEGAFWREARDGACRWFATVLGPDFNAAHADHFHLQAVGWGLCR
ncbi:MAG: extensin family protein [Pseudomonadota bacterium]